MTSLPEEFARNTQDLMGGALWECFMEGMASPPLASIRLNPAKACHFRLSPSLADGAIPWCHNGFYLRERPNFTFDPLFHSGVYYVQEASSMFIDEVIRQYVDTPVMMLDLCAAPGGKSTLSLAALPTGSLVVSNEPIRNRALVLMENMQKWGMPNCLVTNNYPKDYRKSRLLFDLILCDVPCSGEGMFRKDPMSISEWSPQHVEKCQLLQRAIIEDAWQCLRPGGKMIYSTCTFNTKENEENIRWMISELGAEPLPMSIPSAWKVTGSLLKGFDAPVHRFIPGMTRGEGLFVCVLRKQSIGESSATSSEKIRQTAASRLTLLWDGTPPHPVTKGRDIIPSHAMALHVNQDLSAFPHASLDYKQAVSFLRRESLELPPVTPRGFVVVTFQGIPLGFVKNIGTRANNHYPESWKIKSTHIPDYEAILEPARPHPDGGHPED